MGIVALLILLKRVWLAWLAGIVIFVWVVIQGMFPPGTPMLDLMIGSGIIGIYIGVILRLGTARDDRALFTHFMLLRAPLTTDLDSWRATCRDSPSLLCSPASACLVPGSRAISVESLITDH